MAVTLETFKAYIGATETENDAVFNACLTDAALLINKYMGAATAPASVMDRCHIIVAVDLWERRNAPNGITNQQYASADGIGMAPMRVARDPLAGVYPILQRWVGWF